MNQVEEFVPTSALPRRGSAFGAAGQKMRALFQRAHSRNTEKLAHVGITLTDDEPVLVRPNGPISTSGQQAGFIWDTFTVAANTAFPSPVTMFSTPQASATKGLAQTNLRDSQMLGAQEELVATGFRLYILNNATVADILALYTNVSVQLFEGPQNYPTWEGLPWMLPAAGGVHVSGGMQVGTAPAGSAVLFSASNGEPNINSSYQFSIPIRIEPLEKFSVQFLAWGGGFNTAANTTNPPGTGLTIVMALEGLRTRQVSLG